MNEIQLLPTAEDKSRAVTVEPVGTDLAPTVQVSLAKRIVHPRTNKVVCLAAKTTVPIEEDEAASVSDLALRLSDGTNVVLSMSFFNDEFVASGFAPVKKRRVLDEPIRYETYRSAYDPERYETHRAPDESWRLWLVFSGICAVAIGSFFYFVPGSFEKSAARIVAALPPIAASKNTTVVPPVRKASMPSKKTTIVSGRKAKQTSFGKTPRTAVSNVAASRSDSRSARRAASFDGSVEPRISRRHSGPQSILVPPPPPTMIPFGQLQAFGFAPYAIPGMTPPGVKATSGPQGPQGPHTSPATKVSSPSVKAALPSNMKTDANPVRVVKTPEQMPAPMSAQTPRKLPAEVRQQFSSRNIFTDDIDPDTAGGINAGPAPVPGNSNGEQPLERISLP